MYSRLSTRTANMLSKLQLSGMYSVVFMADVTESDTTAFRIMKARKTMKNQGLIQEVIQQISQRFAPKIPDIKKVSLSLRVSLYHNS